MNHFKLNRLFFLLTQRFPRLVFPIPKKQIITQRRGKLIGNLLIIKKSTAKNPFPDQFTLIPIKKSKKYKMANKQKFNQFIQHSAHRA